MIRCSVSIESMNLRIESVWDLQLMGLDGIHALSLCLITLSKLIKLYLVGRIIPLS